MLNIKLKKQKKYRKKIKTTNENTKKKTKHSHITKIATTKIVKRKNKSKEIMAPKKCVLFSAYSTAAVGWKIKEKSNTKEQKIKRELKVYVVLIVLPF